MNNFIIVLLFFILQILGSQSKYDYTIAFGSCNKQHLPQPFWQTILSHNPDLWIWLGDVVYADKDNMIFPTIYSPATPEQLYLAYLRQFTQENYTIFREEGPKIIGVWDDHDYGSNDGGAEYKYKAEVKKYFVKFLGLPEKSPKYYSHEGLYSSEVFGKPGESIKVILLDVRFFSTATDFLGEEQWKWLEQELTDTEAQIHIIGSGSQVLPSDKPLIDRWAESDLERLYKIITKHKVPGVILISGDVHHAELLVNKCSKLDYPLYEVTSSGLTHSLRSQVNFLADIIFDWIPVKYRIGVYLDKNYGIIGINWKDKTISMEIYSITGTRVISHTVSLDKLRYDPNCIKCEVNQESCQLDFGILNWKKLTKSTAKIILVVSSTLLSFLFITYLCRCCCISKKPTTTTNITPKNTNNIPKNTAKNPKNIPKNNNNKKKTK